MKCIAVFKRLIVFDLLLSFNRMDNGSIHQYLHKVEVFTNRYNQISITNVRADAS